MTEEALSPFWSKLHNLVEEKKTHTVQLCANSLDSLLSAQKSYTNFIRCYLCIQGSPQNQKQNRSALSHIGERQSMLNWFLPLLNPLDGHMYFGHPLTSFLIRASFARGSRVGICSLQFPPIWTLYSSTLTFLVLYLTVVLILNPFFYWEINYVPVMHSPPG